MEVYNAQPKPSMLRPVVIGGIISGIVSLVPILWYFDMCCLWYIVGAIVAVLIYKGVAVDDVTPGQGALMGLLSGVIGIVIFMIIAVILLNLFLSGTKFPEMRDTVVNYVEKMMSENEKQLDPNQVKQMEDSMAMMKGMTYEQAMSGLTSCFGCLWFMNLIGAVVAGTITAAAAGKIRHPYDEPPPYQLPN